jgi:hypothetical protein
VPEPVGGTLPVSLGVPVCAAVSVLVCVLVGLTVGVTGMLPVCEAVKGALPVSEGVNGALPDCEGVAGMLLVCDALPVMVPLREPELLCVTVKDGVPDGLRLSDAEPVEERVRDVDGVNVPLTVTL